MNEENLREKYKQYRKELYEMGKRVGEDIHPVSFIQWKKWESAKHGFLNAFNKALKSV